MKISIAKPDLSNKEKDYMNAAFDSTFISSVGEYVTKFEKEFAKYVGVKHATTTSNGTTALHLILEAIGVEGKEVIVPSLTFVASASSVLHAKGIPVLVDVGEDWNIGVDKVKEAITDKTAVIMAVHLYGQPAAMNELKKIAKENKLFLLEDCAEAPGAKYAGEKVGSIGNAGAFSFYGNKILTTGEGGMITTNDSKLFEKIIELKNHGMKKEKRYWHDVVGYNYRMTNLQAAIGLAQLERIDDLLTKRTLVAKYYEKHLDTNKIHLQKEFGDRQKVAWLYPILVKDKLTRDKLIMDLEKEGIETRPFFYPLPEMDPYLQKGNFEKSKSFAEKGLLLPCHTKISEKELEFICKKVNKLA
jgi:perosamine synthetase